MADDVDSLKDAARELVKQKLAEFKEEIRRRLERDGEVFMKDGAFIEPTDVQPDVTVDPK